MRLGAAGRALPHQLLRAAVGPSGDPLPLPHVAARDAPSPAAARVSGYGGRAATARRHLACRARSAGGSHETRGERRGLATGVRVPGARRSRGPVRQPGHRQPDSAPSRRARSKVRYRRATPTSRWPERQWRRSAGMPWRPRTSFGTPGRRHWPRRPRPPPRSWRPSPPIARARWRCSTVPSGSSSAPTPRCWMPRCPRRCCWLGPPPACGPRLPLRRPRPCCWRR